MRPLRRCGFAAMAMMLWVLSGCATPTQPIIDASPRTCAIVGGILGAVAGGVIGHQHHDHEEGDALMGAGLGGAGGALAGYLLCSPLASENQPPTARATAEPPSGAAPLSVQLHGVGEDVDGRVVGYDWDLGDGTSATGAHVSHVYPTPGSYTARLTVTDDDGARGSASAAVAAMGARQPAQPRVSQRIVLRGVNFDFDRAEIRSEAEVILDTAAEVLSQNEGVRIEVAGHTDSTGEEAYNQGLSERRARAVADYLASKGIDRSRLVARGYGESSPVADNGTRDGRAQNRRVELNQMD